MYFFLEADVGDRSSIDSSEDSLSPLSASAFSSSLNSCWSGKAGRDFLRDLTERGMCKNPDFFFSFDRSTDGTFLCLSLSFFFFLPEEWAEAGDETSEEDEASSLSSGIGKFTASVL